jgi:hypothetical protein
VNVFPDLGFRKPLMTVCNYIEVVADLRRPRTSGDDSFHPYSVAALHLCAVDSFGDVWFSARKVGFYWGEFDTQWEPAQKLALPPGFTGVSSWNLTSAVDSAFLIGFAETGLWIFRRTPQDAQFNFIYGQQPPNGEAMNPWAGISSSIGPPIAPSIQVHFTKSGSVDLLSGVSAGGPTLTQVQAINPGGVQAQTDEPPAAAALPVEVDGPVQELLIAYKGADDDRLYFAFAM